MKNYSNEEDKFDRIETEKVNRKDISTPRLAEGRSAGGGMMNRLKSCLSAWKSAQADSSRLEVRKDISSFSKKKYTTLEPVSSKWRGLIPSVGG